MYGLGSYTQWNRKLQAKYFWESVLNLETTEEEMKKNIHALEIEIK